MNEASGSDSPYINPWRETKTFSHEYLTFKEIREYNDRHSLFFIQVTLSDTKIIRNRSVYDLISFIADISGFADIFMVVFGLILTNYNANIKLKA
jgi:hypothetical protein